MKVALPPLAFSQNHSIPPCLLTSLFSVFRRRLQRERFSRCTYCFSSTRRRGGAEKKCKQLIITITPEYPPCLFFSVFSAFRRRPQRERQITTSVYPSSLSKFTDKILALSILHERLIKYVLQLTTK